jgi:hypothetical protein
MTARGLSPLTCLSPTPAFGENVAVTALRWLVAYRGVVAGRHSQLLPFGDLLLDAIRTTLRGDSAAVVYACLGVLRQIGTCSVEHQRRCLCISAWRMRRRRREHAVCV